MKLRPVGDRVAVVPVKERRGKESVIELPDSVKERMPIWGKVKFVGPDVKSLKKGDTVIFTMYVGMEIEIDGREYRLIREEEIQTAVDA